MLARGKARVPPNIPTRNAERGAAIVLGPAGPATGVDLPNEILPRGVPAMIPECTDILFFVSGGGGAGVLNRRSSTVAERCIGPAAATDAGRGRDDGGATVEGCFSSE